MAFAGNRIESAGLGMSANYVYSYLAKFHFEYYLAAGVDVLLNRSLKNNDVISTIARVKICAPLMLAL